MRSLIFGMNLSLDGYVASAGGEIDWSDPSAELFEWWLERESLVEVLLYGRKLWQTMNAHWPTADELPDATPAEQAFARNWRDTPKVVFSSTINEVDGNARLVTTDAVAEIARLRAGDGGPMRVGGPTLGAAALRAGLVDEFEVVTHPVLIGGGAPFFPPLDGWVKLELIETRTFSGGVVLSRYATRR